MAAVAALAGIGAAPTLKAQAARGPRIGILSLESESAADSTLRGFVVGMRELGYVEGRNIAFERRFANRRPANLSGFADELVRSKVDVILVAGPFALEAARRATQVIPIVVVGGSDPVAEGWARTLARPGGNVTGLTVTHPGVGLKRLELLKAALPALTRVALLVAPQELPAQVMLDQMQRPAHALGVQLQLVEVREPADFERGLRSARQAGTQGVISFETPIVVANRTLVAEVVERERLAWIGEFAAFGHDGMLMAYGADLEDLLRRAATYVDRILKGARAGDLPIERPTKLDLLLDQRVARALGLGFPQSLILTATRVID